MLARIEVHLTMHRLRGRLEVQSEKLIREIEERKQTEKELREGEARFRYLSGQFEAILDHIPGFVFYKDTKNNFIRVNKYAADAHGVPKEELEGRNVADFHPAEDAMKYLRDDLEVIESGKAKLNIQEPWETGTGNRWLNTSKIPFVDDTGEIIGIIGIAFDITAQKRAEDEKEKLQQQLHQAQKMESVGLLAGGVAHDFNNMLGVILGHTELAMEQVSSGEPILADLQEIRRAAERSANLTRQLLAFARKQTIAPKILDMNETLSGILSMVQRLIGEDIDLVWAPGADTWPVKMDPSQIDQMLANLCVNAREAITDVGKVTIETGNVIFDDAYCAVHAGYVPGEYVVLAVSDDGCGMDREMLGNIFEPFFTAKDAGTGLGLATVYGIVKQNEGFINVYSEPGQGTTLKIYMSRHVGRKRR